MIVFGQRTGRFFLEPYYWCLPLLIIQSHAQKWVRAVKHVVVLQGFLLIPFVAFLGYVIGPGIISNAGRERLMSTAASFYDESRWMRDVLPVGAVICTDVRSRALLRHRVFPIEYLYFTDFRDRAQAARFEHLVFKKYQVSYLVLSPAGSSGVVKWRCADSLVAGPVVFKTGARNPYNRQSYKASIYTAQCGSK
jgi:hypothetical protein